MICEHNKFVSTIYFVDMFINYYTPGIGQIVPRNVK